MYQKSDPWSSIRWLPVTNVSGAVVPPFAVLCVTGRDADGSYNVRTPTSDGECDLINGPTEMAIDAKGQAHADFPAVVAYTGTAPTAGAELGAASGSFYLAAGKYGFKVFADGSDGLVEVGRRVMLNWVCSGGTPVIVKGGG